MSSMSKSLLFLVLGLGFSGAAMATWETDCQKIQQETSDVKGSDPCGTIQNKVAELSINMTPAPFVSPTLGDLTAAFPEGSPFGAATGGSTSSTSVTDTSSASSSSSSSADTSSVGSTTFQ